ncbi:MAG TPA: threonine/serine dehydratase [Steroidobacteraceae bacterium]|nr:threonine/serine dehydratase [Steroidobacteraceae bacterium]
MSATDAVQAAAAPTLADIRAARERIAGRVRHTPLLASETLGRELGAQLYFKCENLQEAGAFKVRGATNALFSLSPEALAAGVVTHSSGNHGAAVARAAQLRGVPAIVVMPRNSSAAKLELVRRYGATLQLCEPSLAARESAVAAIVARSGAAFVHPYDDVRVIAGQGTVALELLEDLPQFDCVLCPVGGGGLASGIALVVKALAPAARVIAVEPAAADDAYRGFHAPSAPTLPPAPSSMPATLADGLRGMLSARTLGLLRAHVDDIVTVSEAGIVRAMRTLWSELHVIVEPSSAVPYAALQEGRLSVAGQRVAIVLTGGNVDLDQLPWSVPPT